MSRIGKALIEIVKGVEVKSISGEVQVLGPKGKLSIKIDPRIIVAVKDGTVSLSREKDDKDCRALHGLYRALINNMVTGVSVGFEKVLELSGVGYRAALSGKNLTVSVGHSHPIEFTPEAGITFVVEGTNKIKIQGIDKGQVGQIAAIIRLVREVEPYKGKGIKYAGEIVRRKAGKAAKSAGSAAGGK
ncbi:MAG: large subunit ribosomal protein L6 [Candidatus Saganbacteria bacterium]|uniref:Large ribosomal subunit protein uL6 n=1 Tax=Candidatus Saganbacteria bacterium TaxID=2575572 RepID=A0A833L147_UNCSA|nr:MAG: large subunit ribosomal protein L6 [Candidatus Saganbacteria bacterium]